MITIRNVSKSFGAQTLLEDASLQINAQDRFALVGPNGAGKSTLFRMLLGEQDVDSGEIQLKRGVFAGYLPQENPPTMERSVLEETLNYSEDSDGKLSAKAKSILMGLGFKVTDFDRSVSTLSGGWAMRVAMARLLLEEPSLLMLDEPTNHLDLESLMWFQEYLVNYRGAIFLISHDREFINRVCNSIVSLENHQLKVYNGNYEFYLKDKAEQRERLQQAYEAQQKEIREMEDFIMRNRARASTAARAQSVMKRLEKIERIQLPPESKSVKIKFPQPERTGVRAMDVKKLCKSYGDLQVYKDLDFELERGWKVAFVGQNGAGKSTLLKILAGVIPFDSGERNLGINVKVGYFSQHRAETLDENCTVYEEACKTERRLSEETIRSVLGSFLFPGESIYKKVSVLSGGEKSRLSLVKLLLNPPNVLLMDEPTTHLDMASVDALIEALKGFEGTICFISHDLYFINALADRVVYVNHGKVDIYPGNYDYFKHRQEQMQIEQEALRGEKGEQKGEQKKVVHLSASDPKEERRRRAQERELEREKNKALHQARQDLKRAQDRIEELGQELQNPQIYADFAKVKVINEELSQLNKKVETLKQMIEN